MASGSGKSIEEVLKAANASDEIKSNAELAAQKNGKPLVYLSELGDDETAARALLKDQIVTDDKDKAILDAVIQAWRDERPGKGGAPTAASKSIKDLLSTITGVDETDRAKVVAAFDAAGIKDLADLGADDTKLDAALGKSGLPPGKINLLKNGLKNARANATAPPAAAATESKTVPSGGVDVQSPVFPTLKAETATMSTPFQIPQAFTSSPGPNIPFVSVGNLQPWQWLHIAQKNKLTLGIDLKKVLAGADDIWVDFPAFLWELNFEPHDITKGETDSTVSATIHQDRFAQSYIAETTFKASYLLCTASATASYAQAAQTDSYSKRIRTRARWVQSRCSIPMENCITLSPLFRHLIDVCFNKIPEDDQFEFLAELFNKFGHVVPDRVYLGGVAEYFNELVSIENKTEASTKTALDAAVEATRGGQKLAGLTVGFKIDGTGSISDADCVASSKLIFTGGDPGKATIGEWIGTVNKPENWYIIRHEGVKPITDFLKEPERDRIKEIQDRQQKKQWITPMIASLAEGDGGGVEIPAHPELPYARRSRDPAESCV